MNLEKHVETVRARLRAHRGSYMRIAEAGDIDYSWLHKFSRGVHKNVGVQSVDKLERALDRFEAGKADRPAA